jgi:hypothetical protein
MLKTSTLSSDDQYTLLTKFIISIINGSWVAYPFTLIQDKKKRINVHHAGKPY